MSEAREAPVLAAALAFGAALIHAQAAADHLGEYWLYGVLFVLVALAQAGWGVLVVRRPSRRLLLAGIIGSAAVFAVWVVSRTVGLPVGPDSAGPEELGVLDVIASIDELAIITLLGLQLAGIRRRPATAVATASLVLVLLSSLAVAGGLHAH